MLNENEMEFSINFNSALVNVFYQYDKSNSIST